MYTIAQSQRLPKPKRTLAICLKLRCWKRVRGQASEFTGSLAQLLIPLRPRDSPSWIVSRYNSQALADHQWLSSTDIADGPRSVVTSVAAFENSPSVCKLREGISGPESVVTGVAGFAPCRLLGDELPLNTLRSGGLPRVGAVGLNPLFGRAGTPFRCL
jgi:hypothetical protein